MTINLNILIIKILNGIKNTCLHLTNYKYHNIYTYNFNLVLAEIQNRHGFTSYKILWHAVHIIQYTHTEKQSIFHKDKKNFILIVWVAVGDQRILNALYVFILSAALPSVLHS
jgi:hypothetical protein